MRAISWKRGSRSHVGVCKGALDDRYPVWVKELFEVECDECDGGIVERIVGEDRSGMGGISPITKDYPCEECEDGLLGCHDCGETPAYQAPSFDRLCLDCLREVMDEMRQDETT